MCSKLILVLIFIIRLKTSISECKTTYIPICDSIHDVRFDKNRYQWTELLIQPKNDCRNRTYQYTLTRKTLTNVGMVKLKRLTIVKQLKKANSFDFLRGLNLQYFTLYGNTLTTIKKNAFERISLNNIHLKRNRLENINVFAFSNCYFQNLDLSHNELQRLQTDSFYGSKIIELVIKHNGLRKLQNYSLPLDLKMLYLDYNNLKSFSLSGQNSTLELIKLTLSHNQLTNLDTVLLNSVVVLDLSYNNFETINAAVLNLEQLQILNLNNNNIAKFSLSSSTSPSMIFLENNRLRTFNFSTLQNGTQLFLLGNPWNCQCFEEMYRILRNYTSSIYNRFDCTRDIISSGKVPFCVVKNSYREKCSDDEIPDNLFKSFQKSVNKHPHCFNFMYYFSLY